MRRVSRSRHWIRLVIVLFYYWCVGCVCCVCVGCVCVGGGLVVDLLYLTEIYVYLTEIYVVPTCSSRTSGSDDTPSPHLQLRTQTSFLPTHRYHVLPRLGVLISPTGRSRSALDSIVPHSRESVPVMMTWGWTKTTCTVKVIRGKNWIQSSRDKLDVLPTHQ